MTSELFLYGLFIISLLTSLCTEGIKKWLQERKIKYYANALAGYVAIALSVAIGTAYLILTETAFNAKMAVFLIALTFLSWIIAMVGYDKFIQTISQFKKSGGDSL